MDGDQRRFLRARLDQAERDIASHRTAIASYTAALATHPDIDDQIYFEALRSCAVCQLEAEEGKAGILRRVLCPAATTSTATH
jgi:hypothetical protein